MPAETHGLFVYGSLTVAEVLEAVFGRVPAHRRARAIGWRTAALRDRPFPGLVPAQQTVHGLVLMDLTPGDWDTVDSFEGPMYALVPLDLEDGTAALTYACTQASLVLPQDWQVTQLLEELPSYLERCRSWQASRRT